MFIEGARVFKHKKCILERNVFTVIAANVGQKESGSCPAVVVEGVCVCGGMVRCVGVRCGGGVEVCDRRERCIGVLKVCGTVLEMGCVMCPHAPL